MGREGQSLRNFFTKRNICFSFKLKKEPHQVYFVHQQIKKICKKGMEYRLVLIDKNHYINRTKGASAFKVVTTSDCDYEDQMDKDITIINVNESNHPEGYKFSEFDPE